MSRHHTLEALLPAVTLVAAGLLLACGAGPAERDTPRAPANGTPAPAPTAAAPPRVEPGPWLVVDADGSRLIEDRPIYHQGPQRPPVPLETRPLVLPVPPSAVPERHVLAQAVISHTGLVTRARLLRVPSIPNLDPAVLEARLIATLRTFRYEPAELDGEPVAVYFSLTLKVEAER